MEIAGLTETERSKWLAFTTFREANPVRKIAIVGGGQSGLQLALGLLQKGYDVTVVSNRTPEQIRKGRVTSSQFMFNDSLQNERDLAINFWEKECPKTEGIAFTVPGPDGGRALFWEAKLDHSGESVDQRVKFAGWTEEFAKRGGKVVLEDAGIAELEKYAASNDLVILAAGKGEVARMFETDKDRTPYSAPMRALALTYVKGMVPRKPFTAVSFNLIPGVGEYFVFPALTTTGACEIMVFEGVPGGAMDCWADVKTPDQHLQCSKEILQKFLPWEAERCQHIELTDEMGIVAGRFAPTVRKPICKLPSGKLVLGMADVVVLNDPITGQGSNTASKAATLYMKRILEQGEKPFDAAWMQQTFDSFWNYAQWVVKWTNSLLTPPPPHILNLMGAATQVPALARKIANGFNNPPDYNPWWFDAAEAAKLTAAPAAGD
jgi:flavin-dependent dehydrogenase